MKERVEGGGLTLPVSKLKLVNNAVISQQQLKHMTAAIVVAYQIVRATLNDRPSPLCVSSFSQTLPVVRQVNCHVGFRLIRGRQSQLKQIL